MKSLGTWQVPGKWQKGSSLPTHTGVQVPGTDLQIQVLEEVAEGMMER